MQTSQITFTARHLGAIESGVLRAIRLSERPLTLEDVARITRFKPSNVLRAVTRLMKEGEADQIAGGFIATAKGQYQTVLAR